MTRHTKSARSDKYTIQDSVQIVTNDFKTELRVENHWLLFAPIPVEPKNCVDYESGLRNARASCNGEL